MSTPAEAPEGVYILSLKWSRSACLVWWRPDGAGYTIDLDDAGIYTSDDAAAICRPSPSENIAVPVSAVAPLCARVVLDSHRHDLLARVALLAAEGAR